MNYKYTLLISKYNGETTDITSLVQEITWAGRKGSAARSLSVILLDDDGYLHARSDIDVEEGYQCMFAYDGTELFRGTIKKTTQNSQKAMSFLAYDCGIYLANNKDTFCYTNKTASEIFRDVCTRFGFEVDAVAQTAYRIPELTKKKTYAFDAICDALSLDFDATGIRHYVTSQKGKLSLITRRENIMQWVIETGQNLISYSYVKSIEDVKTRVKMLSDEGTVLAEQRNTALESKLGITQEVSTVDETLTTAQIQELCKTILEEKSTPARTLSLDVSGLTDVISGIGVYVIIPHLGISRTFYVDQDTHTFKGNQHTMSLTLNYATDLKTD